MKLTAELASEKHELEITREGSRVLARIDGRELEVEVSATRAGVYLLRSENRVYECHVERRGAERESLEVLIGNHAYSITLADPKRWRSGQAAGAQAAGAAQLVAQMPGKVVRVLIEAGAEVEAGAGLLVIEAMKMQNELKAPKAGTITSLNVTAGATVNAGDVLAIIE